MSSPARRPQLPHLSTTELERRRSTVVLVDVHGPPYFASGHIPGAVNIPPHDVVRLASERIGDIAASVVVYGASRSSNAGIVADQLLALGYSDVSLYDDGLEGWIAAGLPVERAQEEGGPGASNNDPTSPQPPQPTVSA